jgi:hypothetical protein
VRAGHTIYGLPAGTPTSSGWAPSPRSSDFVGDHPDRAPGIGLGDAGSNTPTGLELAYRVDQSSGRSGSVRCGWSGRCRRSSDRLVQGVEAGERGGELVAPGPGLVDTDEQSALSAGDPGGDVQQQVAQRRRSALASSPSSSVVWGCTGEVPPLCVGSEPREPRSNRSEQALSRIQAPCRPPTSNSSCNSRVKWAATELNPPTRGENPRELSRRGPGDSPIDVRLP